MNLKNVTYVICNHQNNLKNLQRKIIVDNSNLRCTLTKETKPSTWSGNHVSVLFTAMKGIRGNLKVTDRLYEMEAQIP